VTPFGTVYVWSAPVKLKPTLGGGGGGKPGCSGAFRGQVDSRYGGGPALYLKMQSA